MTKVTSFSIVHFHFHRRKTGVTRSIEQLLPFLKKDLPTYLFGYGVSGEKIKLFDLLKVLYGKTPTVVHVHRNNEMLGALLLRFFGAKFSLFFTRHSATTPSGITRFLMNKADRCIYLTPKASFTTPDKSDVVPHGIDLDYFTPGNFPVKERKTIGVVGRIRPMKGQAVVLEGLIPFLQENPDWSLRIIGKIDKANYANQLQDLASKEKIQSQVIFEEPTPDIRSFYHRCSLIINASFSEGFSLVPLEAMACGCSVIATKDVGIHSSLIENNVNGFLFTKGDTNYLKEQVNKIVENELYFAESQLRKSIINWDIKVVAKQLITVYKTARS